MTKSSPSIGHLLHNVSQIDSEDFVNFCGLLRKHELYNESKLFSWQSKKKSCVQRPNLNKTSMRLVPKLLIWIRFFQWCPGKRRVVVVMIFSISYISRVFLQHQLWIVNYYVKSLSNILSNENIKTVGSREIIIQK